MAFTVTHNGNGSTGGSVPVDSNSYASGAQVTVLGNTGSLTKTGATFAYWNTAANGSGTVYGGGQTFAITGNLTLYAQWYITDGLTGGGVTTHYAFPDGRRLGHANVCYRSIPTQPAGICGISHLLRLAGSASRQLRCESQERVGC
jgi:hypothetical protein